jgi:DNA (cytosine-5)-methyltransferase 1
MSNQDIRFIIVDLFCGAGGTTTGFLDATDQNGQPICKVIACVNHDPLAILSHYENHPEVKHFTEDIRTLDLTELIKVVKEARKTYPNAFLILWASLECTNFSKAKGGQPRDADSRTLADHLHRYEEALSPDFIKIENVVEFMAWGPLDDNGKPISRKNGTEWLRWRGEICAKGYTDQWKQMCAADYGGRQKRNRLFGVFARHGLPVTWPEPTHAGNPEKNGMFTNLKKHEPVRPVLDLEDEGNSIFNRKKPPVDNSLHRVYAGLIKFVAGMKQKEFLSKYYSGHPSSKNISLDGPAGTVTTSDHHSLVNVQFLMYYNSTDPKTGEKRGLSEIDKPCRTLATQRTPNLVLISSYHGSGHNITNSEDPCQTIVAADILAKINVKWIDRQYSGSHNISSVNNPIGTILTNPKASIVTAKPFITSTNYAGSLSTLDEPLGVITANRKYHYLVNPSWIKGNTSSVDKPCPVVIARQDKSPLYVVAANYEDTVCVPVYEDDSEIMVRIKEFMAMYGISDIKMRMLKIPELLPIQGFPSGYILKGTQKDQKKFIGNAVHPIVVKKWIQAMHTKLQNT